MDALLPCLRLGEVAAVWRTQLSAPPVKLKSDYDVKILLYQAHSGHDVKILLSTW